MWPGSSVAVAGLLLSSRWPAGAFATAAVVARGPDRVVTAGADLSVGLDAAAAHAWRWCGSASRPSPWPAGPSPGKGRWPPRRRRLAVPALVDLACAITAPSSADWPGPTWRVPRRALRRVAPTVVAITGSFGKTSTKGYVAHLVAGTRSVVASPASFNNRAGLARAVNEHLADGTEVFVAEMGTYGRGEIAELCSWVRPDVAVITAIGPCTWSASVPRTASSRPRPRSWRMRRARCSWSTTTAWRRWPRPAPIAGPRVWRVSAQRHERRRVCRRQTTVVLSVHVRGSRDRATRSPLDGRPGNVAAAVAVALELGVPADDVVRRLPTLPGAPHRLEQTLGTGGVVVLDDTYNANPAGARAALATLERLGVGRHAARGGHAGDGRAGTARRSRRTPRSRPRRPRVATDLVIVGRTNRRALLRGARRASPGSGPPRVVVRAHTPEGDRVGARAPRER